MNGTAQIEDLRSGYAYRLDGVLVSDFTLPAYWRQDWSSGARWDWLGVL